MCMGVRVFVGVYRGMSIEVYVCRCFDYIIIIGLQKGLRHEAPNVGGTS